MLLFIMNHEILWRLLTPVYIFDYDWCEANP